MKERVPGGGRDRSAVARPSVFSGSARDGVARRGGVILSLTSQPVFTLRARKLQFA